MNSVNILLLYCAVSVVGCVVDFVLRNKKYLKAGVLRASRFMSRGFGVTLLAPALFPIYLMVWILDLCEWIRTRIKPHIHV